MRFKYCPDCGSVLSARDLGDEKDIPWCDSCGKPWFPIFPSCIIALIYNDKQEVLLLRQSYISTQFHNLVSGYIQPGENAEECAIREIKEETGLTVDRLELKLTSWFAKKEMLMIGFFAHALPGELLSLSTEVESAQWYPAKDILMLLSDKPGSTSRQLGTLYVESIQ